MLKSLTLKDIFNILPELVIYIKKCSQDGELYDMTLSQYKIAYLINHMVFTFRDRCKVFFEKLENDEKKRLKAFMWLIVAYSRFFGLKSSRPIRLHDVKYAIFNL